MNGDCLSFSVTGINVFVSVTGILFVCIFYTALVSFGNFGSSDSLI